MNLFATELWFPGREATQGLEAGESVDAPDTVSFPNVGLLFETFNPRTMQLLETISDAEPVSIRETARLVDRDVTNGEELTELE